MKTQRGELKKAGDLFAKYRQILIAPEKSVINAFQEVVEDLLGINYPAKKVRYDTVSKTLSLSASAVEKSEIKLHAKDIISHLKGRLGEKNAPRTII